MKQIVIDRFAAFILGSKVWGEIQGIVHILDSTNLTGVQKREQAIEMFKQVGIELAGFLLNLGLELAVTLLRSKISNEN